MGWPNIIFAILLILVGLWWMAFAYIGASLSEGTHQYAPVLLGLLPIAGGIALLVWG